MTNQPVKLWVPGFRSKMEAATQFGRKDRIRDKEGEVDGLRST